MSRRGSWMAAGLTIAVIARSVVFVFWPGSHFDSDQAVTGLMAKHLSELRAFPVFWYGQTYMLGVEAWLAAPIMLIGGATVTALKLPLLAMNVAIALLLFRGLVRDAQLAEHWAAFATLFFVLASPITSAHLLTANGGNVEPALNILAMWCVRARAIWLGLVLGVGFLNREFTIYGMAALVLLDVVERTLFTRATALRFAKAFATAVGVWAIVMWLRHYSSAAGPGTSLADLASTLAANNLVQVAERLCLDPRAIVAGIGRVFTVHWPELFGLEAQPLTDFGIESTATQGATGAAWLLLPILIIPLVRLPWTRAPLPASTAARFPHYLVLTAVVSITGYLVGRCGVIDFYTMRYELLSLLGAAGLAGWYLRRETSVGARAVWLACCSAVFALSLSGHARLLVEYVRKPPVPAKQELVRALDAKHARYAYADYWTAYYVTFMTRERILVASTEVVKVRTHNRDVDAHAAEAVHISRRPCAGGEQLTAAFWSCGP